MLFGELCSQTAPAYFGYASQIQYMRGLFAATKIRRTYSEDYLKAVFNGTGHFTDNMKKQFPKPVDAVPIADFFESHLKPEFLKPLADSLGILSDVEKNAKHLSIALAAQIKAFIESKEEDVENITPSEYEKARINQETRGSSIDSVLYDGDMVWVEEKSKRHDVDCYEHFTQTWVIHNYGKAIWHGRQLVCVSRGKEGPKFADMVLDVPETMPNGLAKISTDVHARGMEGKYVSLWEMRDSSGENCFPGSRGVFDVTINIRFHVVSNLEVVS